MHQFSADDNFNCGDTWPVGSFRLSEASKLIPDLIETFDIPCWPELTGLGAGEELVGFWADLYAVWDQRSTSELIEIALQQRPGFQAFLATFQSNPLPVVKGQMIGPSTLIWALNRRSYPVVDQQRVLQFIHQAFLQQAYLLAKTSYKVIISLDEPCAGLSSMSSYLWRDFFDQCAIESQFGLALHCCGQPQAKWLDLPWNVVHFDMKLLAAEMTESEEARSQWEEAWSKFFAKGSWLAAGVVDSEQESMEGERRDPSSENLDHLLDLFIEKGHERLLLSTSCGLAETTMGATRLQLNHLSLASERFLRRRKSH